MSRFFNWNGVRSPASLDTSNRQLDLRVLTIRQLESDWSAVSDDELVKRLRQTRTNSSQVKPHATGKQNRVNVAAAIGSIAVSRTKDFRLHDVQIKGAIAAANGSIIQMNTGEGKTLVCGLSAILRWVFDSSVHVATTNSYLAQRDHEAVEPIFRLLGISSQFIGPESTKAQLRAGYRSHITYAPGYVFGFDYLKDQILIRENQTTTLGRDVLEKIDGNDFSNRLSQTGHQSIIVDEADSVLIDESTTPLLLSGPSEQTSESALFAFELAKRVSDDLSDEAYRIKDGSIELSSAGIEAIHSALKDHGRIDLIQPWNMYISNAIYAKHLLIRDENYVVSSGKIKLVDQNTGRIFDDRSLRAGLHQAVEAKEGVPINPPNTTLARITRQRFFQLYDVVCGMTGTVTGNEDELHYFYGVNVIPVPPNKPCQRVEYPDRFFQNYESKLRAIVADIETRRATGQPILIGTRTILESTCIQDELQQRSIECQILNGIQNEREADLIAQAGHRGKITIATNMAGRGTDIKLSENARSLGGLHVIGTQRFESRRVDRQLAGRAARQGDPGSCQFYIAADDDLMTTHNPGLAQKIANASDASGNVRIDFSSDIERLQASVERNGFAMRKKLVKQERWFDQVRQTVAG